MHREKRILQQKHKPQGIIFLNGIANSLTETSSLHPPQCKDRFLPQLQSTITEDSRMIIPISLYLLLSCCWLTWLSQEVMVCRARLALVQEMIKGKENFPEILENRTGLVL